MIAWILAAALQPDRAAELLQSVTFAKVEAKDDAERRLVALLTRRELWISAFRELEAKLGPFPDGVPVAVSFDLEGSHPSRGGYEGKQGTVKFNLPFLAQYQAKVDALEERKKELAKKGQRLVYKVPPLRIERLVHHELVAVFLRGWDGPDWFVAGMASYVQDDPSYVAGFAAGTSPVEAVDVPAKNLEEAFGRGHLFFRWLGTKGWVKAVAKAVAVDGEKDLRKAVAAAAGSTWEDVVAQERVWSAREIAKLRD